MRFSFILNWGSQTQLPQRGLPPPHLATPGTPAGGPFGLTTWRQRGIPPRTAVPKSTPGPLTSRRLRFTHYSGEVPTASSLGSFPLLERLTELRKPRTQAETRDQVWGRGGASRPSPGAALPASLPVPPPGSSPSPLFVGFHGGLITVMPKSLAVGPLHLQPPPLPRFAGVGGDADHLATWSIQPTFRRGPKITSLV